MDEIRGHGGFFKTRVFVGNTGTSISPDPADVAGFNELMKRYTKGLAIESAAVKNLYGSLVSFNF